ncbi:MAG: DUF1330 domain-containing protein [Betaproteobacteria bacterium]|jgi:uncharacterized protein (DUF1330 family)|nr:DUF1330 domain-containing protein [Betaproteobacteria bacterium]
MPAYIVVDTVIQNEAEMERYKLRAKPLVEKFGGQYLARGGQLVVKERKLWSPTRIVLLRFDSVKQAEDFYESAEYQELLPVSRKAADRTFLIVEGIE